jgi:flagellar export protein FliJ
MRPFRFELEAVRTLREHAENAARVELAGELLAGADRDRELVDATATLAQARTATVFADGAVVNAWDILATDAYLQRRESAHAAATQAAALQAQRIELHRTTLIEASRRRQTLERLKLRRRDAHRAAMERLELAQLNEVALILRERRLREAS